MTDRSADEAGDLIELHVFIQAVLLGTFDELCDDDVGRSLQNEGLLYRTVAPDEGNHAVEESMIYSSRRHFSQDVSVGDHLAVCEMRAVLSWSQVDTISFTKESRVDARVTDGLHRGTTMGGVDGIHNILDVISRCVSWIRRYASL